MLVLGLPDIGYPIYIGFVANQLNANFFKLIILINDVSIALFEYNSTEDFVLMISFESPPLKLYWICPLFLSLIQDQSTNNST